MNSEPSESLEHRAWGNFKKGFARSLSKIKNLDVPDEVLTQERIPCLLANICAMILDES